MFGFDLAVALLIIGVLVLCATTAISILPWRGPGLQTRRQHPSPPLSSVRQPRRPIEATHRRVITGHPASMERLSLTVARPDDVTTDSRSAEIIDVDAAEALIDRLLQTDPELVAALMTQWIHHDLAPEEPAVADGSSVVAAPTMGSDEVGEHDVLAEHGRSTRSAVEFDLRSLDDYTETN